MKRKQASKVQFKLCKSNKQWLVVVLMVGGGFALSQGETVLASTTPNATEPIQTVTKSDSAAARQTATAADQQKQSDTVSQVASSDTKASQPEQGSTTVQVEQKATNPQPSSVAASASSQGQQAAQNDDKGAEQATTATNQPDTYAKQAAEIPAQVSSAPQKTKQAQNTNQTTTSAIDPAKVNQQLHADEELNSTVTVAQSAGIEAIYQVDENNQDYFGIDFDGSGIQNQHALVVDLDQEVAHPVISVTYDHLNNASYTDSQGKVHAISRIQRTFTVNRYYDDEGYQREMIFYADPTKGFWYEDIASVTMTQRFFDEQGQAITFKDGTAYYTVSSLNHHAQIEAVSGGENAHALALAGSSVTNHNGVLYSDNNNNGPKPISLIAEELHTTTEAVINELVRLDHLDGNQTQASDYHADTEVYQGQVWDNSASIFQFYGAGLISLSGDEQTMTFTTRNDTTDPADLYTGEPGTLATFQTMIPLNTEDHKQDESKPADKQDTQPSTPTNPKEQGKVVDDLSSNSAEELHHVVTKPLTVTHAPASVTKEKKVMPQMNDHKQSGLIILGALMVTASIALGMFGLKGRRKTSNR
ncbi:GbpC/Spa domain-containing protein [Lacticaseibacillus zeae]|nr:GbpC/Spa domain-containing protein [Lacticaseibacillus zeae]